MVLMIAVIASEAKQSMARQSGSVDCFVAELLAMTRRKRPGSVPAPSSFSDVQLHIVDAPSQAQARNPY
jgi:hypothetical protein